MSRLSKNSRQSTGKMNLPAQISFLHAKFKSRVHKYIFPTGFRPKTNTRATTTTRRPASGRPTSRISSEMVRSGFQVTSWFCKLLGHFRTINLFKRYLCERNSLRIIKKGMQLCSVIDISKSLVHSFSLGVVCYVSLWNVSFCQLLTQGL